jgi:hypothetical protein
MQENLENNIYLLCPLKQANYIPSKQIFEKISWINDLFELFLYLSFHFFFLGYSLRVKGAIYKAIQKWCITSGTELHDKMSKH